MRLQSSVVAAVGIRALKNNLSRYVRRVERGERISVTAHGRVVAELVPPKKKRSLRGTRLDDLIARGIARPPLEKGDPFEHVKGPALVPPGTVAWLIDTDRDER